MFYVCLLTQKIQIAIESDNNWKKIGLCFSCLEYLQQRGESCLPHSIIQSVGREILTHGRSKAELRRFSQILQKCQSHSSTLPTGTFRRADDPHLLMPQPVGTPDVLGQLPVRRVTLVTTRTQTVGVLLSLGPAAGLCRQSRGYQ